MRATVFMAVAMFALSAMAVLGPIVIADKGKEGTPEPAVPFVIDYWVILDFPPELTIDSVWLTPLWHGTATKSFSASQVSGGTWVVNVQSVLGVQTRTCAVDIGVADDGKVVPFVKRVVLPVSNHCLFSKDDVVNGKDGWVKVPAREIYEWVWYSPVLVDVQMDDVVSVEVSPNWLLKLGESWSPLARVEGGAWLGVEVCPITTTEKEMKTEVSVELKDGSVVKIHNAKIRVLKRLPKP